jgi:hypothetical protein
MNGAAMPTARDALSASMSGLLRPARLYRSIAVGGTNGPAAIASAFIPFVPCLILVALFPAAAPSGERLTGVAPFLAYVAATWPAAAAAFWAVGKAFGSKARYAELVAGWGQSYWATMAFLIILFVTHVAIGFPSDMPDWMAVASTTAYFGVFLWKILYAALAIREILGLRSWRAAAAFFPLCALCALFALLSALVFGLKIPIV